MTCSRPASTSGRAPLFGLVFIVHLSLSACASPGPGKFTRHYPHSLFKVMERGHYSAEVLIKAPGFLRVGENTVDIIIHNKNDQDVFGAEVRVVPSTRAGEAVPDRPVITERGRGVYRAENVVLDKAGSWELKIAVKKDAIEDSTVFPFPDIQQ